MKRKLVIIFSTIVCLFFFYTPVQAISVQSEDTPNYKISYYAFDCFNMQDKNGKKYGYGYDMMQKLSGYLQCTFSYIGYDKSAKECEEMLKEGKIDIYTAAKITPEREADFVFSTHPAITSTTCMNIKRGSKKVIAGDYSTYNGLKIGLLERHTYNDRFIQFTKEKGFDCKIVYYTTPTELSKALVNGEVDAIVNSYIRTPEDEETVENFGETPYYFMARKENQDLINDLDNAIDQMNIDTPNWRSDLYNIYYGNQNSDTSLTFEEKKLLKKLQEDHTVIKAIMRPDNNPYSWYTDEKSYGIIADIFKDTAKELKLKYKIITVSSKEEYRKLINSGNIDICMDIDGYNEDKGMNNYKLTDSYMNTNVSILRKRGSSGKIMKVGTLENNIAFKEIIEKTWPDAKIVSMDTTKECVEQINSGKLDGVLMMSYTAQKVARDDTQNRLSVDIVPGAILNLKMGVNSSINHHFYRIWNKALYTVSQKKSAEYVQNYIEEESKPTLLAYLFDHPAYFITLIVFILGSFFMIALYVESNLSKNKQLRISKQLAEALTETKNANNAKSYFFSKMSHDIRTPMNVVLGMTQVAKKYKHDPDKLEEALDNISNEGSYLLSMINSILDINQLEYGHVELLNKPFNLNDCLNKSIEILKPLAERKNQELIVSLSFKDRIVVGDASRYSQIMVNVISNAIKYTQEGGKIEVSLESLPHNIYRFICKDNGCGMEQDFIQHICEDYSRAEDSRISSIEGTGLGMSVVKGFTELMNGSLKIESEVGKGSTFIIDIAFNEPTQKEVNMMVNSKNKPNKNHLDFNGKRVLLVEDNTLNAEIAKELLHSMGFIVDLAENGQEAVNKFEQVSLNTYFAIFMDIQMPIMNGIEATRHIRNMKREDCQVFIFAMTADTLISEEKSCRDAGMNGFITKPIDIGNIENVINEVYENNNNREELLN